MARPLAHTHAANPHWLPAAQGQDVLHIPGSDGLPVVGNTLAILSGPHEFGRRMVAKYGNVWRDRVFGARQVALFGPDANKLVLFDRDKLFSNEQGWGPTLNLLFPRGLMLLDFERHRADRRVLAAAFKPEPMRHYAAVMNRGIAERIASWEGRPIRFYDEIKALTLDLAAEAFLGVELGANAERLNRAFVDTVRAAVAPVRRPWFGTTMRAGVKGRQALVDFLLPQVAARRAGTGEDIFSRVCRAVDDEGEPMPADAIVDHMIFLMMAAHDTTTSSITSMLYLLGGHPEAVAPLEAEAEALFEAVGDAPTPEDVEALGEAERAFKETLRMVAPVPSLPRRALRPFSFGGYDFPAGARVSVSPAWTHMDPAIWPEPERFDPSRFIPESIRERHKFAWVPFGGGAHMCLGLHFAVLQARLFSFHLHRRYRVAPGWELDQPWSGRWIEWPIPKPRDGLPLTIERQ